MTEAAQQNPYSPPRSGLSDNMDTGADTTFTLNLFSPAGRIGRVRYLGYSMGLSFLIMMVGGIIAAVITPMLVIVPYIAMFYVHVMLAIKRSHDFNTSGWLSLLVFVPIASMIFLFIPGTDGPNRFGNKTAPNGNAGVFVIIAVVAVAMIGILAAIAIPAYQDYVNRAKAKQAQQQQQQSLPQPQSQQ